jgi:hypothetical protein
MIYNVKKVIKVLKIDFFREVKIREGEGQGIIKRSHYSY